MGGAASGSIGLVGDLMMQERLANLLQGDEAGFHGVLAALAECDVAVANLEMPLSERGSMMPKWANLRGRPEIIDDIRTMGFQAVSLANNHMMDFGHEALLDTLATCDRAGIVPAGAGPNIEAALAPVWLNVGGRRVALVSVASTIPPGSEATEAAPGIAPVHVFSSFEVDPTMFSEQPGSVPVVHTWVRADDQDRICRHVETIAKEADAVIVAIHWGVPWFWSSPYLETLADYQQPLGRALIDAGASLVFGHHSHSLHGIEVYRGRPIVYSSGNFIFQPLMGFMQPESMIVQLRVGERLSVEIVPLLVDERGLPYLAEGSDADRVFGLLQELSQPFATMFERHGNRAQLVLA